MDATRFKRTDKGFTIIEIMIVLVIASLIMIIVFFAVPAAGRVQRNAARRSYLGILAAQMDTYKLNNGRFPRDSTNGGDDRCSFLQDYATRVGSPGTCTIIGDCAHIQVDIYDVCYYHKDAPHTELGEPDRFNIMTAHSCVPGGPVGGEYVQTVGSFDNDYRKYVVWAPLEKAPYACTDNALTV